MRRYRYNRIPLQRLYSNFANGWPGRGLLLLRLAIALFLIKRCLTNRSLNDGDLWLSAGSAVGGLFLLGGLWTPVAGVATALLEIWIAIRTVDAQEAHLLCAALACGLTVLGPGAWSLDARLFGRRRISIEDR